MRPSSLTKKYVVAATGFFLFLFLIGHMAGNLLIFRGQDAINTYGEKLKDTGPLLWGARIGLLALLAIHLYFTISISLENRAARKTGYAGGFKPRASTIASRSMFWTGLLVLIFIVYHLAHFTLYWTNPEYGKLAETVKEGHTRHDVYAMVTHAFSNPVVVLIYLGAMAVVFTHLAHGVASLFATLGLSNFKWSRFRQRATPIVVGLLIAGFLAVPLGVLFGLVKRDPKGPGDSQYSTTRQTGTERNAATR
jgi:succinate dehydrogenase / fumarate reductase cytochrome b subunit